MEPIPEAPQALLRCALGLMLAIATGCGKSPQEKIADRNRDADDPTPDSGMPLDVGDDDDGGVTFTRDPDSVCAHLTERTRACGLLEDDEQHPCIDPWDSVASCLSECALDAECDDISAWVCSETPLTELKSITDCTAACTAKAFECADGRIIPPEWKCDSEADCEDGADEDDCGSVDNAFTCDDGQRIPQLYRCDSSVDCVDGSDEVECGDRLFDCKDGSSIPAAFRCDGQADCRTLVDEVGCPKLAEFMCNGK